MLATVRNRRGVISAVEPFAAARSSELLHLVTIEFSDSDGDSEETLLWERERQPVHLRCVVTLRAGQRLHEAPADVSARGWNASDVIWWGSYGELKTYGYKAQNASFWQVDGITV